MVSSILGDWANFGPCKLFSFFLFFFSFSGYSLIYPGELPNVAAVEEGDGFILMMFFLAMLKITKIIILQENPDSCKFNIILLF